MTSVADTALNHHSVIKLYIHNIQNQGGPNDVSVLNCIPDKNKRLYMLTGMHEPQYKTLVCVVGIKLPH